MALASCFFHRLYCHMCFVNSHMPVSLSNLSYFWDMQRLPLTLVSDSCQSVYKPLLWHVWFYSFFFLFFSFNYIFLGHMTLLCHEHHMSHHLICHLIGHMIVWHNGQSHDHWTILIPYDSPLLIPHSHMSHSGPTCMFHLFSLCFTYIRMTPYKSFYLFHLHQWHHT